MIGEDGEVGQRLGDDATFDDGSEGKIEQRAVHVVIVDEAEEDGDCRMYRSAAGFRLNISHRPRDDGTRGNDAGSEAAIGNSQQAHDTCDDVDIEHLASRRDDDDCNVNAERRHADDGCDRRFDQRQVGHRSVVVLIFTHTELILVSKKLFQYLTCSHNCIRFSLTSSAARASAPEK